MYIDENLCFLLLRFAIEIQPTGKVSEYTATITDETLREGKRGRNKVESLKLVLKTEGTIWEICCYLGQYRIL